MIDLIVSEYKCDFPHEGKFTWAISAKKKLKKLDDNLNLIIPWSCNYPSYLYRDHKGHIRVDTSHNHHWGNLDFSTRYVEDYDMEYKKSQKSNFFNLQTGKLKTRLDFRIDEWLTYQKKYGKEDSEYINNIIKEMREEAEKEYEDET